jgi:TPR repeat protein
MMSCCCKLVCNGCAFSQQRREQEQSKIPTCPFCRHPRSFTKGKTETDLMRRIEVNDPIAMRQLGRSRYFDGDYNGAFEYWKKSAELGDAGAHYELSVMYYGGEGVEKDKKKEVYHLEEAAIGGHPDARHNIGCAECESGRRDRAVKHWIIAANLGYDSSIEALKNFMKIGFISKEGFAAALRAHQAAIDATKSPQRKAVAEFERMREAAGELKRW